MFSNVNVSWPLIEDYLNNFFIYDKKVHFGPEYFIVSVSVNYSHPVVDLNFTDVDVDCHGDISYVGNFFPNCYAHIKVIRLFLNSNE